MELVAEGLHLVIAPAGADGGARADVSKALAAVDFAGLSVLKSVEERRFTLGVAYPALRADVSKALDGHRDFMTPDEVEATAWGWMARSRSVGLFHSAEESVIGRGTVVESYIWRAPELTMKAADGTEQTVYPGDWLAGVVWDAPAWTAVRKGLANGFSPQGATRRRTPSADALAQLRRA